MKPIKFTRLPVRYKGSPVLLGYHDMAIYIEYSNHRFSFDFDRRLFFILDSRLLYIIAAVLILFFFRAFLTPRATYYNQKTIIKFENPAYAQDALGFTMDLLENSHELTPVTKENYEEQFLIQKQLLLTRYLITEKVSRPEQLSDSKLLELNQKIAALFVSLVLDQVKPEAHVYTYFTDHTDLNKIETALMEQAKFHVPASIKLAQSALETAYGRRIVNNNYFGIKDKRQKTKPITTTEYYNKKEFQLNKAKVISWEMVNKNGQQLYKCLVRDHFMGYQSPWESFRAHSVYLVENERYSPLFTKGKNYEAWAEKIGSTKYGGVGYATSPIYGQLLKKIIGRYHLHLLDF